MKRFLIFVIFAFTTTAHAQYPNRPVKLVVPFTPGTGIDILARVFAQKLQERTKNPVVVENRPGASGNIGTEAVAKAPADGYTLLMTATTIVQSAVLNKSVPYDPKGLTPIGLAAIGNLSLVAHSAVTDLLGTQRSPATPDVPSLAEAGVRAGLLKQGLSPRTGTPAELAKLIESNLERWGRLVREARISAG